MFSKPAASGAAARGAPKPRYFRGGPGYLGKQGDLIFLGSMQPAWGPERDPNYRGSVLTRQQKLKMARCYTFAYPVPLCIDHADGATPDFVIPPEKVIGFATGILIDRDDNALMTGYIDKDRPEAKKLIADMQLYKKKWGLSAYTRFLYENERKDTIVPDSKLITHVGVTLDPAFAEEGSWIFEWSTNPQAIARIVREREIQKMGCLANEELMDACGVASNVKQHVVSILETNITLPDARPTERALPPEPDYSDAPPMASNVPPNQTGTGAKPAAPGAPSDANKPATQPPQQPNDPMQGVTPTGSTEAKPKASADVIKAIIAALIDARKTLKEQPPLDRDLGITNALTLAEAALKEHNLTTADMGDEFGISYYGLKNDKMALREEWATEAEKLGGADNNFNKDWVEKLRSNGTQPDVVRQIGGFVEATKALRSTTQKEHDLAMMKQRDENEKLDRAYKDQLESKRKADDMIKALSDENDKLKRRAVDAAPLTGALASKGFNFFTPPPAPSNNQGQAKSAPPVGTGGRAPSFNFMPGAQTNVPTDSSNVAQHAALSGGSPAHSMVLDQKNNVLFSSNQFERPLEQPRGSFRGEQTEEGFVSATGFQVAKNEFQGARDAHSWANTFVLDPSKSAFNQGFGSNGAFDPTFAYWYQTLGEHLERQNIYSGLPFNYDDSNPNSQAPRKVMNDAAIFGLSNAEYNLRLSKAQ